MRPRSVARATARPSPIVRPVVEGGPSTPSTHPRRRAPQRVPDLRGEQHDRSRQQELADRGLERGGSPTAGAPGVARRPLRDLSISRPGQGHPPYPPPPPPAPPPPSRTHPPVHPL